MLRGEKMPESKRPLKVFLCHAHADRDPVRGLYTRLTKDGVDAWLDKAKLLPGQDWELEIRKAVREADVVVVCLSKQFNQAGFRQKEVKLALDTAMEKPEGEIFIIPARLEECDTLESLKKWHWVDLFEEDGHEMLMRALRTRADKIGATLQIKKSWLPKVNTQPTGTKKTISSIEKPVEEKRNKPDPEKETKKRGIPKKAVIGIVGFAILVFMVGIFILYHWLPQPAVPTATNLRLVGSSTLTTPSETPNPGITSTRTLTSIPTNMPTPLYKEGAIYFNQDFENVNVVSGWSFSIYSPISSSIDPQTFWSIGTDDDGNHVLIGDAPPNTELSASTGYSEWKDYVFEFRVKVMRMNNETNRPGFGADMRGSKDINDNDVSYGLGFNGDCFLGRNICKSSGCSWNLLASTPHQSITLDRWYEMRIELFGPDIKVFVDGKLLYDVTDDTSLGGTIALAIPTGGKVYFDDIRVTELVGR